MKRSMYLFIIFCHLTLICASQNYVNKVEVRWKKNGVWHNSSAIANGQITISPDYESTVDVTLFRNTDAPSPTEYFLQDVTNGKTYVENSTNQSHTFFDCVGPFPTQLIAAVGGHMVGSVSIFVEWAQPEQPDLRIARIRVDKNSYSSGLSFQVGQTVWVRCDVWNAGNKDADQNHLGFYIKSSENNTTGSPTRSYKLPGSLSSVFGAGKTYGTEFEYTFTTADIGTKYFVFKADYLDAVFESDENNNVESFGPFQVVSPPNVSLSPSSQSFGSLIVNSCSDDRTFQLVNNGSSLISGQIKLDHGTQFNITGEGGNFSLGAGNSRTISVKFCPESAGSKSDFLKVYVDGMPSHIAQASLSGSASIPPESFFGISDEFVFDTRGPMVNSGGIFLKVIETAGTNMVKKVGYNYSYIIASDGPRNPTEKFDVDDNGYVFLSAPPIPNYGVSNVDDFEDDEILLFDDNDNLIGHIPFSYSFKWEGMHSRHAVIIFHNDDQICLDAETGAIHFPYNPDSPNNPPDRDYNYYEYGEYPVSMLIPPHFKESDFAPQGYRFPPPDDNVELLLFVHGLTGSFSYQEDFGARSDLTEYIGDQVSYWYGTERAVNHKTDNAGNRKYHAWQFYYPNEDDLRHCAMTLRQAVNYLKSYYSLYDVFPPSKKFGIIAHSMGGLVALEYLTTNSQGYNQTWFNKFLISQTPSHGSLAANNQYLTDKGYLGEWQGQDREAPCYRDMSIGSDFIRNLHGRDWETLLDFNNSGTLNDNVFVLMGLTDKDYRIADWGDWWKPIYSFDGAHQEAANHDDGVVSFSSASLLSKGIGFAGFMGNHDDGKFNAITHDGLMPGLIDTYLSSSSLSGFAEYCIQHEPLVEVFIDGEKNIVIPQSGQDAGINDLSVDLNNVDMAKGMVTFSSNIFDELNYPIYWHERQNKYVIQKGGSGILNLKPLGVLMKNEHNQNQSMYYFWGSINNAGVGFVFQNELAYVELKKASGEPLIIGTIGKLNMEHQFISFDKATKDESDEEELTPTKPLVFVQGNEMPDATLLVDNQTTSAEFILYSQTYDEDEIPYALQLISPNGVQLDSTSVGITYQHDYLTSVKRITVNNPQHGEWEVSAFFESADGYSPGFITLAKLASGIKAKSLVSQFGHDIQKPITLEALIEAPDPGLFDLNNIQGYFILYSESGRTDTLEVAHIQPQEQGIELSSSFSALNPEIYSYTLIVTGIYSNERFERAVYGDFLVEDLMATLSIPDQQTSFTNRSINLTLPNYLSCRLCDQGLVEFEVGIENSTFADDHIYYFFSPENGVLSINVVEEAPLSYMTFYVNALVADSLIATTTFRLSHTPAGVPVNLTASDITQSRANLSWTPRDAEQRWDILYGITGFDPANEGILIKDVTEIPYALEGLDQGVGYDFYVRAVFDGENNYSAWSWPGSFTTNYAVVISGSPNGTVSPEGTHDVQAGGDLLIIFTPDEGYHVEDVVINGESLGRVSSYFLENILSNSTVYVSFAINKYTISVTVNPENTGTVSGSREYNHGETVSLTATPNDNYLFQQWTEGPSVLSDEPEFSFAALRNRNLVAHFSSTTGMELINTANVMIYPNPVQTRLNVVTIGDSRVQLIRVFDLLGQEVFRENNLNEKHVQIDVSQLPGGIYIVHILTDQGVAQAKIQVSER